MGASTVCGQGGKGVVAHLQLGAEGGDGVHLSHGEDARGRACTGADRGVGGTGEECDCTETGECERRDGNMGKRKRRRGDGISG